jgi:DNA polymerase delta subunit 1
MRIFEPILGPKASSLCKDVLIMQLVQRANPSVIVSGDHTRTIQIATPTVGGLMKFAVKTRTCLGCKTALKPTNSVPGVWFLEWRSGWAIN